MRAGLLIAVLSTGALTVPSDSKPISEATFLSRTFSVATKGKPLDLKGYILAFNDDFDHLSIVQDTETVKAAGKSVKWFSPGHSSGFNYKWHGPNDDPSPFSITPSGLRLRMIKGTLKSGTPVWFSGSMSSVDREGHGFSATNFYAEITAKIPRGWGTWPAFWTMSLPLTRSNGSASEIDIAELYGDPTNSVNYVVSSVHLWKPQFNNSEERTDWHLSNNAQVGNQFDDCFHRYGMKINKYSISFFVDDKETSTIPTIQEELVPRYFLIDLAMNPTTQPHTTGREIYDMYIRSVKVWVPRKMSLPRHVHSEKVHISGL